MGRLKIEHFQCLVDVPIRFNTAGLFSVQPATASLPMAEVQSSPSKLILHSREPTFDTLAPTYTYQRPPKRVADATWALVENIPSNPTPELVRRQSKLAKTEAEALSLAASIAVVIQLARETEAPCTLSEGQRHALAAALAGKTGMGVNLSAVTSLSLQLDCLFMKAICKKTASRLAHLLRRAVKLVSLDCRGDFASADHALDLLEPILQATTQDLEELALPACVSATASAARQRLATALIRFGKMKKIHLGLGWGALEWIETVVPPGCSIVKD
jgi:hypothetical protein